MEGWFGVLWCFDFGDCDCLCFDWLKFWGDGKIVFGDVDVWFGVIMWDIKFGVVIIVFCWFLVSFVYMWEWLRMLWEEGIYLFLWGVSVVLLLSYFVEL